MKIRKESAANVIPFENVSMGNVFKDEEGGIYMKLDFCYMRASGVHYNAVSLEYGRLVYFDNPIEKVEVLEKAILTY